MCLTGHSGHVNDLGMFMNIYFKTAVNIGMIWSTIFVKTSEFYRFSRFVLFPNKFKSTIFIHLLDTCTIDFRKSNFRSFTAVNIEGQSKSKT